MMMKNNITDVNELIITVFHFIFKSKCEMHLNFWGFRWNRAIGNQTGRHDVLYESVQFLFVVFLVGSRCLDQDIERRVFQRIFRLEISFWTRDRILQSMNSNADKISLSCSRATFKISSIFSKLSHPIETTFEGVNSIQCQFNSDICTRQLINWSRWRARRTQKTWSPGGDFKKKSEFSI